MSEIRIDAFAPPVSAAEHQRGTDALRKNLAAFAFDALTLLEQDLREGVVKRGTWDGCVLSYAHGAPGSVHRPVAEDGSGSQFFLLWDRRTMRAPEVLREVQAEIRRRLPEWTPPALPHEGEAAVTDHTCPICGQTEPACACFVTFAELGA